MTRGGVPSSRSRKFYMVLASAFALAFLEWLVTFMLFGNAVFAFFITQFARYFELPIPCLICSRLDHIFLGERVGFYGDLICRIHKLEISSLVFCRFHDKLVDVHELCEDCLCSFGADEEVDMRSCYCCDQRWKPLPQQISSLVRSRSIESEAAELDVPLLHEFNQKENAVDVTIMSAESALESDYVDSSSHFVYNELKVTSDTELDGHVDDKKDSMALVLDTMYSREITGEESVEIKPEIKTLVVNSVSALELEDKTLGEAFAQVGTINMVSVSHKAADSITYISAKNTSDDDIKVGAITMKPPIAIPDNDLHCGSLPEQGVVVFERETSSAAKQSDLSEDHYGLSAVESTSAIWHGLVELYSVADTVKVLHSSAPELIDINEMQEPSTIGDEDLVKRFLSLKVINVLESSSSVDDSVEQSDNSLFYAAGTREVEQAPVHEVGKLNESTTADAIDLNMKADPTRVSGGLSLLWSQLCSTRGSELPFRDSISPRMSANLDDYWRSYDPSASKSVEMEPEIQTLVNNSISALEVEVKTLGEDVAEVRTMDLVSVSDKVDSRTYISRTNSSDDDIKVEAITMEPPVTTTDIYLDHASSTEQGVLVFEREKSSTANQSDISEDHDGPSVMDSNSAVEHGLVEESDEHITTGNVPESSTFVDDSVEQSDNSVFYPAGTREVEQAPVDAVEKLNELTTADAIDLNMKADPTGVSRDLRLLWSQLSSTQGFELPVKDSTSPRMSANVDDYWKAYEPSASIGMQISQKRTSLHISDSKTSLIGSSIESWDLSIVSEIEGESELDQLKRQAERDRKLMTAVCKELEEERNASADAANQAMAMITRLQEEKAAVQIEALQDIRMMEEQVEFYVEALEKLNVLLEQKKKEMQRFGFINRSLLMSHCCK